MMNCKEKEKKVTYKVTFNHRKNLKTKEKLDLNILLTNLLELLFLTVLAFPNASSKGLDSRITSLTF